MYGAAAVLAIGAGVFLLLPRPVPPPVQVPPPSPPTFSAQDIVQKFGNATVVVYLGWSLYDDATGQKIYQN